MMSRESIHPGSALARHRSRAAYRRRRVDPVRFYAVALHMPASPLRAIHSPGKKILLGIGLALTLAIVAALVLRMNRPAAQPPAEDLFVFEDAPPAPQTPPPDPSPPPTSAPMPVEAIAPPPQFGMQEEALSEAGEMAVATGNTLMTEADSVVKAPVAALPAVPQNLDQAPRILKGRPPEYPAHALERGLEATVIVLITIDTLGRVSQVDVERSGGRDFDPDVIRSVRSLVFQPPVRNGQRLTARFRQPYEFKLQ